MCKKEFSAVDRPEGGTGGREGHNLKWVLCLPRVPLPPPPPQCQGVRRAPRAPVERPRDRQTRRGGYGIPSLGAGLRFPSSAAL